jgi:hypothetical protein
MIMRKEAKLDLIRLFKESFGTMGFHKAWVDDQTGHVNVKSGMIQLKHDLNHIPVQLGHVEGNLDLKNRHLESLTGCATHVTGSVWCSQNLLTTLEHAPVTVGGDMICYHNPLENLVGMPDHVGGMIGLTYKPHLPLLKCLNAQEGVDFVDAPPEVQEIMNDTKFKGKGKAAAIACAVALTKAGYKENARW